MTIEIPDIAFTRSGLDPEAFKIEFAVWLYEKERLSFGQARTLSGLDEMSFRRELKKHGVYYHFDIEDLEKDLKNLGMMP